MGNNYPSVSQKTVTFVKHGAPLLVAQGIGATFHDYTFAMSDLPENGAYAILFQEYRLRKVDMFLRPMFRANSLAQAGLAEIPLVYVVFDPTSYIPVSIANYQTFENVIVQDDSSTIQVSFCPVALISLYDGIITSAYAAAPRSTWLQTAEPSIPHNSLHIAVLGNSIIGAEFQQWNLEFRYTLEFRGFR